ncbi:MAG TPA: heavy metal translocating P-type ATPase, partial [Rectinemataceae bacterium]
ELVQGAAARKAPAERFLSRFASAYTPIVVGAAALVAALPPIFVPGELFSVWLHRALVLLVISCPCALVISVPLGYFGGLGSAARRRILFKGADNLDTMLRVKTVVFDKTGTLTRGEFEVQKVEAAPGFEEKTILSLAAAAESVSPHPIAKAIRRAAESAATGVEAGAMLNEASERRGLGVSARVGSARVLVGKAELLRSEGVLLPERGGYAATEALVAINSIYAGRILVADRIRPEAREAIDGLVARGVRRIVMLTGDNEDVARAVASELGIVEVRAGLLPEGKAEAVAEIRKRTGAGEALAFVGDGMNDAPVLAGADLGIAMGGLGSDAAIEAADAVIMDDDLRRIPEAIGVASKTRRIVIQNIVFSLAVKTAFLVMGAAGLATMWEAVIADVGVALVAVLNSVRTAGSIRAFLSAGSRP